jgi:hypothetical protein
MLSKLHILFLNTATVQKAKNRVRYGLTWFSVIR